jgi:undecaprenyl diphosphate synthase
VKERETIMENNVRLIQIGRREPLPEPVLHELDTTRALSEHNTGLTLCLAINYGARDEIVDACRSLARAVQSGDLQPDEIDQKRIAGSLYTAGLPDPDLLIRTAGEMRISNFLLWQVSYAELYVTDVLWPDFRAEHLKDAILEYVARDRRFGTAVDGIPPQE